MSKEKHLDSALDIRYLIVVLNPLQGMHWAKLGVMLQQNGEYQKAIAAYRSSIVINSKYIPTHLLATECYLNLKEVDDAQRALRTADELIKQEANQNSAQWKEHLDRLARVIHEQSKTSR